MALTDTFVKQTKQLGKHFDGGGMYLHVMAAGKYWRLKYYLAGKERLLSLGVYPAIKLAQARKARDTARELLAQGIDPSVAKRQARIEQGIAAANLFEAVALEYHAKMREGWGATHAARWIRHMEKDIWPYIGRMPIRNVTVPIMLDTLQRAARRGVGDTVHRLRFEAG
ncbi:MAG: Arm DNA-binding domain-containing protein [Burkholderiaceae bacterium]|nr:Arm DNA-binding domain-containing protein [Burkholderiaceae bacterium]